MGHGQRERWHVFPSCFLFELLEYLLRPVFLARSGIDDRQVGFQLQILGFQLDPAFVRGHGFLEHALLPVGEAEAPVGEVEVRVDVRDLLAFRDRLIVPAGVVVRPAQIDLM